MNSASQSVHVTFSPESKLAILNGLENDCLEELRRLTHRINEAESRREAVCLELAKIQRRKKNVTNEINQEKT